MDFGSGAVQFIITDHKALVNYPLTINKVIS